MKLNLITLDTVKSELGLTDTTYDTKITAMIPKVSADIRRILNEPFRRYIPASADSGESTIEITWTIPFGTVLQGDGIPDDTYLVSYDVDNSQYAMSDLATADVDEVVPTVNISQWSAISKMIWYRIGKLGISDATDKAVASVTYGKISKTYASSEINKRWNYPQTLLDDLGIPKVVVG
jgi:hypothetical protein